MKFFFSLSILLILVSCGTIKPKQPQVTENKIQMEQKVSTIHVPIEINLKNYLIEAEKQTPKKFEDEKQECEGISFWYKLERNPLAFDGKENQLFLDLYGKYSIKINYCPKCTGLFSDKENCIVPRLYASCGVNEPMRRIQVSTSTTLSVNKDYKIDANTSLNDIVTEDKCEITVFKYDATEKLVEEMEKALKEVTADIDKK
jgi:Zn-finger nucleic acid-binding protein